MEDKLTKPAKREIIEDFANEIKKSSKEGAKPSFEVIYFRNEHINNIERPVLEVPVEILRFRKNNGRISSDVLSYEKKQAHYLKEVRKPKKYFGSFLKIKTRKKPGN